MQYGFHGFKNKMSDSVCRLHTMAAINTAGELIQHPRGNQINSGGAVTASVNPIIDFSAFL